MAKMSLTSTPSQPDVGKKPDLSQADSEPSLTSGESFSTFALIVYFSENCQLLLRITVSIVG